MKKKSKKFYFVPFIIIAVIALLSAIVMLLWNNVLAEVVNVKQISYWQAAGLLILSKILFTSFRPGPPGGFRRGGPPWRNKLMNLSDEERDQFRKEWEQRKSAGHDDDSATNV
jgi:hypothetical protein